MLLNTAAGDNGGVIHGKDNLRKQKKLTYEHVFYSYLFVTQVKEAHHGIHFADETMEMCVRQWLKKQDRAFYHTGIHTLVKRWTETVEMDEDYVEE
ncbi:hypothetical protein Trydic_g13805 [Trypoxylus dichotomus]